MIEPHTRAVNEDKTANALTSLPPTRVTSRSAVSAVRNHEKALALAHRYGLSNHPDQRDAYQELSHRLLRQVQSANCRRLALCLVDPTHGSTPIVGRLAASLASMKSGSIAMIETLARPAMAGLTIEDEEQVIDAILGRRAWREMVCQVGDHPFDVIQVPSYLLSRERLGDATRASAWRDFTNQYRLSLVDACSWETRPTPEQLPPVDGVVLLAGLRTTMRRAAGKAAEAWRAAGANILGTIAMAID